jgi:hypothetical protein
MKAFEAIDWLYRHGGRWSVRATSAACLVTVALGGRERTVRTSRLDASLVEEAVADAVEEIQADTKRS